MLASITKILDKQAITVILLLVLIGISIISTSIFKFHWLYTIIALMMIAALVFGKMRLGIYILLLVMPVAPSLELGEVNGRSLGMTIEYALIALFIIIWGWEKLIRGDYIINFPREIKILGAFVVIASISLVVASMRIGINSITTGIIPYIGLLEHFLLFLIIVNTKFNLKHLSRVLKVIFIGASIAIVINLVFYFINFDSSVRMSSAMSVLARNEGVINNPNSYASYVMIVIFIGIAYYGKVLFKNRVIIIVMMVLGLLTIVLSGSRSVLLAVFASIVVFAMMNRKMMPIIIITFTLPLILLSDRNFNRIQSIGEIIFSADVHRIFSQIDYTTVDWEQIKIMGYEGYGTDVVSGALRIVHWIEGLQMVKNRPMLGYGYHLKDKFSFSATSENYFLDIWIMTGIGGLLAIIVLFYLFYKHAQLLLHSTNQIVSRYGQLFVIYLVAIIVVCLTGSVLFSSKVATYFWVLSAYLIAMSKDEKDTIHSS